MSNKADAVAQARERVELYFAHHRAGKEPRSASVLADIESLALDALIAAVRAECADRVRGLHGQHLTLNRDEVHGWELALTSALAALEAKA